ncbi:MAG: ferritin family protein [Lentisphaerae bacterium]|nr:ferritin family protein [Lentisphaerota bacterium]
MSIVFNADEVLAMAERIERNGGAFYRKAAELNAAGRELLLKIAGEEDVHLARFSAMRGKLAAEEVEPVTYDPMDEAALYLKALADGAVFTVKGTADELLRGKEPLEEILGIAVNLEKDSIVFYSGLKVMVPKAIGGQWLDVIIKEEESHVSWLNQAFNDMCQASGNGR